MTTPYDSMNTGLLLYIPYRALEERVLEAIRAEGHEITTSQARVFQRVGPEGSRQVDLAAATQLTKQSVGFLVDQLVAAGYVERRPDPQDARARLVTITPRGAELARVGARCVAAVEADWTDLVGPDDLTQLRRTLARLSAATDRHAGGSSGSL